MLALGARIVEIAPMRYCSCDSPATRVLETPAPGYPERTGRTHERQCYVCVACGIWALRQAGSEPVELG